MEFEGQPVKARLQCIARKYALTKSSVLRMQRFLMIDAQPTLLDASWVGPALLLSQEAGWNQIAADWHLFFSHGRVFGFVAEDRLVATAAVLPYGDRLGWISMVLVTAKWRKKGLATKMVSACISNLRESGRAAFLDAAPAAVNIYRSLGFIPLCGMERWQGEGRGNATSAQTADFEELAALDRIAFGADRRFLLEDFTGRGGSSLLQTDHALGILRRGHQASQLGPILGEATSAPKLIANAIQNAQGPIVVDVLEAGSKVKTALAEMGFQRQRSFTRMAVGFDRLPGDSSRLLAAAGPEFG